MQNSSVNYIIGFCAAVCLVCSIFVCVFRVGLMEQQEVNKTLDRQRQVLSVSGLLEEGAEPPAPEKIQELFTSSILSRVIDLSTGDTAEGLDANIFDQQKAKMDPTQSQAAPKNLAGVARLPNKALVYMVRAEDDETKVGRYILPVEGKGLWSTLYGYVAIASDTNRIEGLTFYTHGETPGLGGEVDNPAWKDKWPGRLIYGSADTPDSWNVPKIKVVKGLAGTVEDDPHRVDGLSGATITSNGVTYLLQFWLGENGFQKFLTKQRATGAKIQSAAVTPAGRSF